jgi:putative ABC transport system permease protein
LLREIQARLHAIPGVQNVAEALTVPLGGDLRPTPPAPARTRSTEASIEGADIQQVTPGYFETLRTPLLAGRTFRDHDNAPGRNVAVIDQLFAAEAFPDGSAVGRRILLPNLATPWAEVIGVVAHQRLASLGDPGRKTVYLADGFWGIGVSRY